MFFLRGKKRKKKMQLNHFADPFQNSHASVEQFFDQSNMLTGHIDNQTLGYGFSQNPSGYEWGSNGPNDPHAHRGGHAQEFKTNGGYHNEIPSTIHPSCNTGTCGGDPQALARANLRWEKASEAFQGHLTPEQVAAYEAQVAEQQQQQPEYIYSGPDDLDYDDESVAPTGGVPYWQRRMPTIIIHGVTILFWMWTWSQFGFSKLLTGTAGSVVFWGFIGVMIWGVVHSDHRAALYSEEREVQKGTESVLKLVVKIVAVIATILLSFEVLRKRSKMEQHAIYTALGIAFFSGMIGLLSYSARKRGETVRRYRKIKGALLNLAIGMIAVAALLSFGFGTSGATISSASIIIKQKGGQQQQQELSTLQDVEVIKAPQKQVVVEVPQPQIVYTSAAPTYDNNIAPTYAAPQNYADQYAAPVPQYNGYNNYYEQPAVAPTIRQY